MQGVKNSKTIATHALAQRYSSLFHSNMAICSGLRVNPIRHTDAICAVTDSQRSA